MHKSFRGQPLSNETLAFASEHKQRRPCGATFTCGSACMTVSSRALIPLAIFRSFSTAERHGDGLKRASLHGFPTVRARALEVGAGASMTHNLSNHFYLHLQTENNTFLQQFHTVWTVPPPPPPRVCVPASHLTSCYSQNSHDSDDGWIYGQSRAQLQLLQGDAHDGQRNYGDIQLIPPERKTPRMFFVTGF